MISNYSHICLCLILLALQVMDLDRRVRRERERRHQEVEPAPPSPLSTEQFEQLSVVEEKLKKLLEQVEALGEAGKRDEAEVPMRKVLLFFPDFSVKHLFPNWANNFTQKSMHPVVLATRRIFPILFFLMD